MAVSLLAAFVLPSSRERASKLCARVEDRVHMTSGMVAPKLRGRTPGIFPLCAVSRSCWVYVPVVGFLTVNTSLFALPSTDHTDNSG